MCGRHAFNLKWQQIHAALSLQGFFEFPAHFNIAPTQEAPVVRVAGIGRTASLLRLGLMPHWADDLRIGSRMINARPTRWRTSPPSGTRSPSDYRTTMRHHTVLSLSDTFRAVAQLPGIPPVRMRRPERPALPTRPRQTPSLSASS